uniref:G-protein coupled receptors family 1 profile domain-containing protein n=1 Tax=Scylla olivacea TaxID=85551 RepID=A0A0P4W5D8_SCYOL
MWNITNDTDWEAAVGVGEKAVLACVGVMMGVVGGTGNWLVVILVARSPTMRPPVNLLLASVAVCDALSCCLLMPLELASLFSQGQILPTPLCHAHAFLWCVVEVEGVTVLAAVCVDRYLLLVRRCAPLGSPAACRVLVGTWTASVALALVPHLGVGGRVAPPLPGGLTRCVWVPVTHPTTAHWTYIAARCLAVLVIPALLVGFCLASILARSRSNMTKVCGGKGAQDNYTGVVDMVNECGGRRGSWMPLGEDLHHRTRTVISLGTLCLLALLGRAPLLLSHLGLVMGNGQGWAWFPWVAWWAYFPATVSPLVYTFRINNLRAEVQELCPWLLLLARRQRRGLCPSTRQTAYLVTSRLPSVSTPAPPSLQVHFGGSQHPRGPLTQSSGSEGKRYTFKVPPTIPHRPALRMWSSCRVGCARQQPSSRPHQHASL